MKYFEQIPKNEKKNGYDIKDLVYDFIKLLGMLIFMEQATRHIKDNKAILPHNAA